MNVKQLRAYYDELLDEIYRNTAEFFVDVPIRTDKCRLNILRFDFSSDLPQSGPSRFGSVSRVDVKANTFAAFHSKDSASSLDGVDHVAVKELVGDYNNEDELLNMQKMILKEAAVQTTCFRFAQPLVPGVFGLAIQRDKNDRITRFGLVMEFVDGLSLSDWLDAAFKITKQIRWRMVQLLLIFLVSKSLLHLEHYDLHTDNILVKTVNDVTFPVVIDFGLSRLLPDSLVDPLPAPDHSPNLRLSGSDKSSETPSHSSSGVLDRSMFKEAFLRLFPCTSEGSFEHKLSCSIDNLSTLPTSNELSFFSSLLLRSAPDEEHRAELSDYMAPLLNDFDAMALFAVVFEMARSVGEQWHCDHPHKSLPCEIKELVSFARRHGVNVPLAGTIEKAIVMEAIRSRMEEEHGSH